MRPIELLLALAVFSAHAEEPKAAPSAEGLAQRSAKQSSRDVKVPRRLVTLLEKEYREYLTHNQLPAQESLKRKLLDVSVELRQKRPAALHEEVRINTPIGGGVIDLADFVTPLRGAFQMQIKPSVDHEGAVEGLRVFYVSQAKERSVGGEDFGAGCGKFMEVTSYFTKKMAGAGFELYTAEQRYVSVVGGIFVLAAFAKDALQVGSVSFMDSRFPELTCE
jgi:hypothetical protein